MLAGALEQKQLRMPCTDTCCIGVSSRQCDSCSTLTIAGKHVEYHTLMLATSGGAWGIKGGDGGVASINGYVHTRDLGL